MSAFILYAVHAALALVLAPATFAPVRWRSGLVVSCAALGVASGAALALGAAGEATWRSVTPSSPRVIIIGATVACGWLVVGARRREADPVVGALVGVASSALVAATLNDWVVVALLFWLASSLALIGLLARGELRVGALLAIVVSDLALAGGLALHSLGERTWTMPESLTGLAAALALMAFVIRSGAVPRVGVWEVLGTPAAPALPLLLGGPLALLVVPLPGASPWLAAAALALAVVCCVGALAITPLTLTLAGAWPAWLALGLALASPEALPAASVAALFGVTAVALWPASHGLARPERGMILGWLPLTAGFVAIAGVAVRAFDNVAGAGGAAEAAPWSAIAALLPVAAAAGVALGARAGRQTEPTSSDVVAAGSVWILFAVGLVVGLIPASSLGFSSRDLGSAAPGLALHASALVLGLGAAAVAWRRATPLDPASLPSVPVRTGSLGYSEEGADTVVMVAIAALVGLGALTTVVYLAFEGLSFGFLPARNL
ncbi:MAG: hypothetical protein ACR2H7_07950 [Actinomycetota bacterium]